MSMMSNTTAPASRRATNLDTRRWTAVLRRDVAERPHFVYAVTTTGIYCRPGCGSRPPRREHVVFFDTPQGAREGGFRACRRCHPDDAVETTPTADLVRRACRLIEQADTPPRLAQVAQSVGMSASHLHRSFKRLLGVTPRGYAAALRAGRVRAGLLSGASVTQAVYEAGYGASSRFYADSASHLGMTPSQFKTGAAGSVVHAAVAATSVGRLLVATTERGVCAIEIGGADGELMRRLRARFPDARIVENATGYRREIARVVALAEEPRRAVDFPLDIRGTAFQRRVWEALRGVRPGRTTTYGAVARRIGRPGAARAVAQACAANPLALAIPCHRVVRGDGGLGGYRWGVARKRALLEREADASRRAPHARRRHPRPTRRRRGASVTRRSP